MNNSTLLLRQVHPSWVQSGRVTSQIFRPTPKDELKLSAYDGDLITSKKSWEHFTKKLGNRSKGTMGVTVAECTNQDLKACSDPELFPEHAVIDFTGFGSNQIEKKSKKLRTAAVERDWLYQPDDIG